MASRGAVPDPSFWRGRRVLLTGHTGFKGSWLTLWLLVQGAQVVGVSLDPPPGGSLLHLCGLTGDVHPTEDLPGSLIQHRLDLSQVAAIACLEDLIARWTPDVVLHLAAQSLVHEGYCSPVATWSTNVMGTLHLLQALRHVTSRCAVVAVTTDKVYANAERGKAFREDDALGGRDPYSSSKAAMELAVASWRESFCGLGPHQNPHLRLATARAGNVIGGGDWSPNRILPDVIRSLQQGQRVELRNPAAVRPWQHVLDPLSGYLLLAEQLFKQGVSRPALNFGPSLAGSCSVAELVEAALVAWPGDWVARSDQQSWGESTTLRLDSSLAQATLGWQPAWDVHEAVRRTMLWYRSVWQGESPLQRCLDDLEAWTAASAALD